MVRFIRSTWPLVQGWFGLVSLCSMSCWRQSRVEQVHAELRRGPRSVAGRMAELDAVVGQHGVDAIRHGLDHGVQEATAALSIGHVRQAGEGELRGPVDGNEQVELALAGADLGDVEVEEADRIGLELLACPACRPRSRAGGRCRGVAGSGAGWTASGAAGSAAGRTGSRRAAAAYAGETPRPRPPVPASASTIGPAFGPICRIVNVVALAPLLDRRRADAIARGQRPHALFTTLDRETHRLCRAGAAVKNLSHNSSRNA